MKLQIIILATTFQVWAAEQLEFNVDGSKHVDPRAGVKKAEHLELNVDGPKHVDPRAGGKKAEDLEFNVDGSKHVDPRAGGQKAEHLEYNVDGTKHVDPRAGSKKAEHLELNVDGQKHVDPRAGGQKAEHLEFNVDGPKHVDPRAGGKKAEHLELNGDVKKHVESRAGEKKAEHLELNGDVKKHVESRAGEKKKTGYDLDELEVRTGKKQKTLSPPHHYEAAESPLSGIEVRATQKKGYDLDDIESRSNNKLRGPPGKIPDLAEGVHTKSGLDFSSTKVRGSFASSAFSPEVDPSFSYFLKQQPSPAERISEDATPGGLLEDKPKEGPSARSSSEKLSRGRPLFINNLFSGARVIDQALTGFD